MADIKCTYQKIIKEIEINQNQGLLKLIDLYRNLSSSERELIRKFVDNNIANRLISYSFLMAVESVRKKSKEKLLDGLIAQSIEDSRVDYRDNVIILFLLYNSAKRLGEDFNAIIGRVAELSSPLFAEFLRGFIKRDDLHLDPMKLSGYKIVEYPEFNYVWAGNDDNKCKDEWGRSGGFKLLMQQFTKFLMRRIPIKGLTRSIV
jgi:hypothetical protein